MVTVSHDAYADADSAETIKPNDAGQGADKLSGAEGTEGVAELETHTITSFETQASSARYASNPNELWSQEDENYITSDDFESEATRKQRERFVSYPDETGRLVTHPVDMIEAQKITEVRKELANDRGESVLPDIGTITRWTSISTNCCQEILGMAVALADGDEKPVNVMGRPRGNIVIEQRHPAMAFRLDPSLKLLQLQSWRKKGYLYPQALFLDENGIPLSRVAQIFTRKKEQTWAAQPYIIGELPVEPEARWLVLFLDYAQIDQEGVTLQGMGYLKFDGEEMPLALRAELVVRATSGGF